MVLDGPAAGEVLFGPGGIARATNAATNAATSTGTSTTGGASAGGASAGGTLVVNASTVGPDESRALAAQAAEAGLRYVEAPVLGSVPAVRAGRLTVLAGGDGAD